MVFKFRLSLQELFSARSRRVGSGRPSPRIRQRPLPAMLEELEYRRLLSLTAIDHGLLVSDPDYKDVYGVKGATWLANANLAATKTFGVAGINPNGSMTWETALNWVAAMNAADYLGHNNWTLPLSPDKDPNGTITNPTYHAQFGFDCDASAMGHLFYDEFGGVAGESVSGIHNASTALFENFQPYLYWGGYWPDSNRPLPVSFTFSNGFMGTTNSNDFLYAIPEFPSDPTDVPQPPPDNNIIPLQPVSPNPSLTLSPDKQIVHDSALNINWLANADLAATNSFGLPVGSDSSSTDININPDGSMNIPTATAWINAMNAADYLGHNNWRMPDTSEDPDNHAGYYHTGSEMGELYYTEFDGQAGSTVLQTHDSAFSKFQNFQPDLYWSGTSNVDESGNNGNKTFSFGNGYQGGNYEADQWFVIPVFDGNILTVTNNHDSGAGSLRAAASAASPGDTIEFSSSLSGSTINLHSTIDLDEPLYIVGPGASKLAISGQNNVGLFDIEAGGTGSTITNLTLQKGQSGEGGAVFDDGASLVLNSDNFKQNQAASRIAGNGAFGGALAVLAEATTGMTVTVMDCQFNNNTATGGAGGMGAGGAVFVDFQNSTGGSVSFDGDVFSSNSAVGGNGGAGAPGFLSGGNGGAGGAAEGGAIDVHLGGSAATTNLSITNSTISGNVATGGNGGAGGLGLVGGNGGNGGSASGGAVYLDSTGTALPDIWTLQNDAIVGNVSQSGAGGNGGLGLRGGNGGNSPASVGGGIADYFTGTLNILDGAISSNSVNDGRARKRRHRHHCRHQRDKLWRLRWRPVCRSDRDGRCNTGSYHDRRQFRRLRPRCLGYLGLDLIVLNWTEHSIEQWTCFCRCHPYTAADK